MRNLLLAEIYAATWGLFRRSRTSAVQVNFCLEHTKQKTRPLTQTSYPEYLKLYFNVYYYNYSPSPLMLEIFWLLRFSDTWKLGEPASLNPWYEISVPSIVFLRPLQQVFWRGWEERDAGRSRSPPLGPGVKFQARYRRVSSRQKKPELSDLDRRLGKVWLGKVYPVPRFTFWIFRKIKLKFIL